MAVLMAVAVVLPATAEEKPVSATDLALYKEAFAAAARRQWEQARRTAARASDQLPAKVIAWMEMGAESNTVPFAEIARFIDDNPDWPGLGLLRGRAEEAIDPATPPKLVIAWFGKRTPLTTDGRVALARALLDIGQTAAGEAMLGRAWIDGNFRSRQEVAFLRKYRKRLTTADHRARLDRLLWDGRRRQAERMLRRVDPVNRPLAIARIRLRERHGGVDAAIRRLSKQELRDPGLLYERLRWRRRKGRDLDAMEILRNAPQQMVRPDRWWTERSIIARRMLARGRIADAMHAASEHGLTPAAGAQYAEAEWLSGWIELRFLNRPKAALERFARLHETMKTPASRARAAYWAARAAAVTGDTVETSRWYAVAATHAGTYHGQLAAHHAPPGSKPAPVPADPRPTPGQRAAFEANELVRIVHRLVAIGERDRIDPFLLKASRLNPAPGYKALPARLARQLGRRDLGVRIARAAYRDGILLATDGYPIIPMPDGRPERALSLAVARQESNFKVDVSSHAGARGLMQLMPSTAMAVAREIKQHFSKARLTSDPAYNVRLGRAYLAMLLDQFNGSYVLSLSAYNAGPGNVSKWIRAYGDPRDTKVDVVDWIEMIPYTETRNYVQRVLANLQVYRQLLGAPQLASMETDLKR
jgi:soluble lytic murein transglycosylase